MSQDKPSWFRQWKVHRLAKKYLRGLIQSSFDLDSLDDLKWKIQTAPSEAIDNILSRGSTTTAVESLNARFDRDPLLGAEVLDEAIVLYKNEPHRWSLDDLSIFIITKAWQKYEGIVTAQRGGHPRPATTPTLRGGGRRRFS